MSELQTFLDTVGEMLDTLQETQSAQDPVGSTSPELRALRNRLRPQIGIAWPMLIGSLDAYTVDMLNAAANLSSLLQNPEAIAGKTFQSLEGFRTHGLSLPQSIDSFSRLKGWGQKYELIETYEFCTKSVDTVERYSRKAMVVFMGKGEPDLRVNREALASVKGLLDLYLY